MRFPGIRLLRHLLKRARAGEVVLSVAFSRDGFPGRRLLRRIFKGKPQEQHCERNQAAACKIAQDIPGWLEPEVARHLYEIGYNSTGDILEVGTYFGRSTYLIACGMRDAGKNHNLITVDIHSRGIDPESQKQFVLAEDSVTFLLKSLKRHGIQDHVIQMIGWSDRCLPLLDFTTIDTVFIDGGHDYESCSKDFLTVRKRIPSDKKVRMLFHDYGATFPGVEKTIDELVRTDPRYRAVGQICSLFMCELAPEAALAGLQTSAAA